MKTEELLASEKFKNSNSSLSIKKKIIRRPDIKNEN
jgi:hypothetical protein